MCSPKCQLLSSCWCSMSQNLSLCQSVSHSIYNPTKSHTGRWPSSNRGLTSQLILYGASSNSLFTQLRKTDTGLLQKKAQCKPFGRNMDGGRNEKSWNDICFTPKWVCSHAVDSLNPSQWWTWSSPPCLLPVILAFLANMMALRLQMHYSSGQWDTCY